MQYRISVPCATDDEYKLEEHVKNYPKYKEAREPLLKAGKRPEVDLVYLHWDGVRANENMHFENSIKRSLWKFGQKGWKEQASTPQPAATVVPLPPSYSQTTSSKTQTTISSWCCHNPHQCLPFGIPRLVGTAGPGQLLQPPNTNFQHLLLQYLYHYLWHN